MWWYREVWACSWSSSMAWVVSVLTPPHCWGLSHAERSSKGGRGKAVMGKALTGVRDSQPHVTAQQQPLHVTAQQQPLHATAWHCTSLHNSKRSTSLNSKPVLPQEPGTEVLGQPPPEHCPPHTWSKWKGTKPRNGTWDRESSCSPLW